MLNLELRIQLRCYKQLLVFQKNGVQWPTSIWAAHNCLYSQFPVTYREFMASIDTTNMAYIDIGTHIHIIKTIKMNF